MSMTCDLVIPTNDTLTGKPIHHTAGVIVHLHCDICRGLEDFWMPQRTDGRWPTEHAKRIVARGAGWRFERIVSPSGKQRINTICPKHTKSSPSPAPAPGKLVLLDFDFDIRNNRA